jgi:hypothetical protein
MFLVSRFPLSARAQAAAGLQILILFLLRRVLDFQKIQAAGFPLFLCAQWIIQASGLSRSRQRSPRSRQIVISSAPSLFSPKSHGRPG